MKNLKMFQLLQQESRGRNFSSRRRRERTPTLSPEPGLKRRRQRSPSVECDELRRLRELKKIQELVVKEDEKYVKEPLDPNLFEWDDK